uniref:Uncharacterized protein LOC111125298 isoform X2 n=1 Tax=Crassostrea virginica TaxID=6565 RepID=A0A8B8DCF0_CRAVI|nr:uncharacterized protein LOC111125298 isoform X2 [Crassostrea virginica]
MAAEVASAPIKSAMDIPDPIPPGNWMARQLRMLNDNSEGLLPPSAGSKRSWDKYNTTTHKDFLGPREFQLEEPNYEVEPFQKKRETVADIMLAPNNRQTFNNWQMPSRFASTDDKIEHFDPPLHLKSDQPGRGLETVEEEVQALNISPTPKAPSPIKRSLTSLQGPQKISRENSLPELRLRSCSPRKEPANGMRSPTKMGDLTRSSPALLRSKTDMHHRVPNVNRSLTNLGGATSPEDLTLKEEFRHSLQPQCLDKAEQWMKLAPNADRKVIEKVLRMAEKKHKLEGTLNKSLQPDAKEAVDKWLLGANETERQVALRFFNSIAGEKLMGKGIQEQKKRLEQVINALECGKGNGPYADSSRLTLKGKAAQRNSRFNHLRLLSPSTRKDRWMHTTWHHLPEYRNDDPVENWSSHYIRPHAVIPRHFVIHPDWG